ncbi:Bestrophin, RFP-TM, chloride channel-domain-containing protein [Blakeslea trispora]|nr:Bestrophin, RFP-TM, chloride channel-domain-containing protein [Blakeslea trispora]
MPKVQAYTVEGYSYLKRPTFLGSFTIYLRNQFVWPDILRWEGSVLLPTLPGVLGMTGFSCLVCILHLQLKVSISVPVSVLGTVSVALGLLMAFRVNTAYDRYWEGRKLIQTVMATIRNLARQVWINIPEETEQDHLEKMRCIKLLLAFFVATKHHLRHEYGTNYYDLETLLPPKWEPISVAKGKSRATGHNATTPVTQKTVEIRKTVRTKSGPNSPAVTKKPSFHLLHNAPAVLVSLTDSIKPKHHEGYMEADDPTHIANIRRSLIQQEFPDSDLAEASTIQIKRNMAGLDTSIADEEEQQERGLLDEENGSGSDSESEQETPEMEGGSRPRSQRLSSSERILHNVRHRFHSQHRKAHKRHLDHSKFTSEEDLPYQGDSDLSLPLEILFRVALFINQAKAADKIESSLVSVTTSSLDTLVNTLTAFERIVHTPIPRAYNIHLKQAAVLYIFFLPFALVDSVAWLTAPIVALVSFTLFGIEAIGAELENPFGYDANDLPLNKYCDELKKEVEYIIYHIPTHSTSILLDGQ